MHGVTLFNSYSIWGLPPAIRVASLYFEDTFPMFILRVRTKTRVRVDMLVREEEGGGGGGRHDVCSLLIGP